LTSAGDGETMIDMLRALTLAALCLVVTGAAAGQALSVLHIKVVLVDAEGKVTPVLHHSLLISDNPASAAPRRVETGLNGTTDVRLRPGNYTVESDQPVVFRGKAYQWTQIVDISAGRDAVLELTADNAEVGSAASATTTGAAPLEADPAFLLPQWQDSVIVIWTPQIHASGFVIDARGLVATSQRVVGTATSVEVQLTPAIKVAAAVLAADRGRDVAILRIDPKVAASVRPVPLGCGQAARPPIVEGQKIFTIEAPLREPKDMTSGTVSRVDPHTITSDLRVAPDSAGGPVFSPGGDVVGITSTADDKDDRRRAAEVVRIDAVCDVFASAEKKLSEAAPSGSHLPVEPVRPSPVEAFKDAVQRRGGSLNPYQISSADFDIAFITPVLIYAAQHPPERASGREARGGTRTPDVQQNVVNAIMDFDNWSEYVAELPPVLLVRVTPKQVEGFWTTVARGAAMTQGMSLPPIKHFKSGFSRLRAFCGAAEVTPIHPFKLERRLSESDGIYEGLYVYDPDALAPECGTVKLVMYSEKEPEKGDTRVVDPKVLQQVWQDFASYRDLR
jgi:S1-C subfamily serine protease